MKQIYTIALLLFCLTGQAQTDTIRIGTGGFGGTYPQYGPIYRFSATSATTHVRSNILLTTAELQAVNLPVGARITAMQFNKFSINSMIKTMSFKLYLTNSTKDTVDHKNAWTSILASHALMYSNPVYQTPLEAGWTTIPVTSFVYNGGALEIATEIAMQGSGGSDAAISWRYSPLTAKYIEGQTGTNIAPDTLNGSNANYLYRPDVRILYTIAPLPV